MKLFYKSFKVYFELTEWVNKHNLVGKIISMSENEVGITLWYKSYEEIK